MNLLVDLNNIAFATRFAKIKNPSSRRRKDPLVMESITREMITWIVHHAHVNQCEGVVIAKDSKRVWRRDIYPLYKASSNTEEDVYYSEILGAADLVAEFFQQETSAYVLEAPKTEADDIIGYWCTHSSHPSIILSTDKDYVQLISDRVKVYSPVQKVYRETEDAQWDLFLKCIRGDKNDNIRSALPRVRETLLRKAYEDDYELLNLLETVREDGQKVGDVFEFNQQLIDLTMQPQHIKDMIKDAILNYTPSKYSQFSAAKYFKEKGLGDTKFLDFKDKCLKNKPVF